MARGREAARLTLTERLRDSQRQATSMSLPAAVHHRLDRLAALAEDVSATRSELVGMLIAGAELDAPGLEERILAYRKMTVGAVVRWPNEAETVDDADIIELP